MTRQEALDRYLQRLRERSEDTASSVAVTCRRFLAFAGIEQMEDLTLAHLEAWRAYLAGRAQRAPAGGAGISLATYGSYIQRVRLWLQFCAEQGWLTLSIEDARKVLSAKRAQTAHAYDVLSDEEIKRVMAGGYERQRALFALGIFAGLRINEMACLLVSDIVDDASRGLCFVHVRRGKGNKGRVVYLQRDVFGVLQQYVAYRRMLYEVTEATGWPDYPLFGLKREMLRIHIKRACREAGITRRISPHSLRHTYAYRLAKASVPPLVIKNLLGHSSLMTTLNYIEHLTASDIAQYAPALIE